jgi:hypothetical protein
MTVKELIEQLQQFKPETKIYTSITDPTDYCLTLELDHQKIKLESELFGDNVIDDFEDDFDEEGEYVGDSVLVFKLEC